jgi:dienelactone hydrolase
MVAFNGHAEENAQGFVENLFSPQNNYLFYGDAFARRGYAVLGVETPHRYNDANRFYGACPGAGCGLTCNATRPPIIFPGYAFQPSAIPCASSAEGSDFEEDGERLLDAQVAFNWFVGQYSPLLDESRRSVVGLSLGGEIAAFTAAMTPTINLAVVSGFSPDLRVMHKRAENHKCFEWFNGGFDRNSGTTSVESTLITEYIDESDIQALIAPRPLIVQTGVLDPTFSNGVPVGGTSVYFASDKQVTMRAKIGYGALKQNHIHSLFNPGLDGQRQHRFSAGLYTSGSSPPLRIPVVSPPLPVPMDDMTWQTSSSTVIPSGGAYQDIFSLVAACYSGTGCGHVDCCP